LMKFLW